MLKVKPGKNVGWNVSKKYTYFHIKSDIKRKKYSAICVINDWQDNTTNCQSKLESGSLAHSQLYSCLDSFHNY